MTELYKITHKWRGKSVVFFFSSHFTNPWGRPMNFVSRGYRTGRRKSSFAYLRINLWWKWVMTDNRNWGRIKWWDHKQYIRAEHEGHFPLFPSVSSISLWSHHHSLAALEGFPWPFWGWGLSVGKSILWTFCPWGIEAHQQPSKYFCRATLIFPTDILKGSELWENSLYSFQVFLVCFLRCF